MRETQPLDEIDFLDIALSDIERVENNFLVDLFAQQPTHSEQECTPMDEVNQTGLIPHLDRPESR